MPLDPKTVGDLYLSGLTTQQIAAKLGASLSPTHRALKASGVPIRSRRLPLDPDVLRRMHIDEGLSITTMAERMGCSGCGVIGAMDRAGIPRRDGSDANVIRMAREGEDGRRRLTEAAHAAVRGKPKLSSTLERAARGRASKPLTMIEQTFFDAFQAAGLTPTCEFPIGAFNIDFAFPDRKLAIEIDPGQWHLTPEKLRADQAKDALLHSLGWEVLRWSGALIRRSNPALRTVAEELVANLKRTRFDPAPSREHRMLDGEEQRAPVRLDAHELLSDLATVHLCHAPRLPAQAPDHHVSDAE